MTDRIRFDGVLVIGAGLAGMSAALAAAPRRVLLISPEPLSQACSSAWAQGGLAAALRDDDSAELHAVDTEAAGAGLVDPAAARRLTEAAPQAVHRLAGLGAPFDRDAEGRFVQSLEAAHSRPRVARVGGDRAGLAITIAVVDTVRAAEHIEVLEGARLTALLQDDTGRVRGALVARHGQLIEIEAPATVLATGGLGGLFPVTTNPPSLKGEGLGLAALAGAVIADPEFVQFHPTAIDVGLDPAPLATEALRGEGAILVDRNGRRFMADHHPLAELAPRDVVARGVFAEIMAGRGAFLDATRAVGAHFPQEFPTVFAACIEAGIDPRIQPIPIAPAAHYHMGGISADAEGRTSLPGLFAVGECASTGVHGANRLASNSLLEAAAFGQTTGAAARDSEAGHGRLVPAHPAPELPAGDLSALRQAMGAKAGVIRDAVGLTALLSQIDALRRRHGEAPLLVAARLLAKGALERRESRGGHWRSDFPQASPVAERTFMRFDPSVIADARQVAAE